MALENLSFPAARAEIINKLSQAIKAFDTSAPASLHQHRRHLYLLERLRNEITECVNEWKDQDPTCPPYLSLRFQVDVELGIPRDFHQDPIFPVCWLGIHTRDPPIHSLTSVTPSTI
jgi:hypothetical protein